MSLKDKKIKNYVSLFLAIILIVGVVLVYGQNDAMLDPVEMANVRWEAIGKFTDSKGFVHIIKKHPDPGSGIKTVSIICKKGKNKPYILSYNYWKDKEYYEFKVIAYRGKVLQRQFSPTQSKRWKAY